MNRLQQRVAGCVALLLAVLMVAPAHAADELGLSWDGATWTSDLAGELFDSSRRWVPGDSETHSFHARNTSSDPAEFSVEVASIDHHTLLQTGDVMVEIRVGSGEWGRLAPAPGVAELATVGLPGGSEVEVAVRATFAAEAPNRSQNSMAELGIRILLVGKPVTGGAATLPETGAPVIAWWLALAAVLIGLGFGLVRSRKESADDIGS